MMINLGVVEIITCLAAFLVLILLVVFVAFIVGFFRPGARAARREARAPSAPVPPAGGQLTAQEILKGRFERGELSREQYERMLKDLS